MLPEINKIRGVHPSYIILREMKSTGIKSGELAKSLGEHKQTISAILNRRRKITPSLSIRLSKKFNVSEDYFMILQASYDVKELVTKNQSHNKPNLEVFRRSLFWDTDIEKINWLDQKQAVIKRVLERGNRQEILEIIHFYGRVEVSKTIQKIKNSRLPSFEINVKAYEL
jgi:addiction module HigA family antidote